jgi:hypothetical protein
VAMQANCNTSTLAISDISFRDSSGTVIAEVTRLGTFNCSGAAPCQNITANDLRVETISNGSLLQECRCTAVEGTARFSC